MGYILFAFSKYDIVDTYQERTIPVNIAAADIHCVLPSTSPSLRLAWGSEQHKVSVQLLLDSQSELNTKHTEDRPHTGTKAAEMSHRQSSTN